MKSLLFVTFLCLSIVSCQHSFFIKKSKVLKTATGFLFDLEGKTIFLFENSLSSFDSLGALENEKKYKGFSFYLHSSCTGIEKMWSLSKRDSIIWVSSKKDPRFWKLGKGLKRDIVYVPVKIRYFDRTVKEAKRSYDVFKINKQYIMFEYLGVDILLLDIYPPKPIEEEGVPPQKPTD